jgi:transcriptional regulator with XRE-family HTH domain
MPRKKSLSPQFLYDEVLGALIRYKRDQAGITQRELSERLHMSQATLSRVECGQYSCRITELRRVARALDTYAYKLLAETDELCARIEILVKGAGVHDDKGTGWFAGSEAARGLVAVVMSRKKK